MPAKTVAAAITNTGVQTSPAPDTRLSSVGPDNPMRANLIKVADCGAPQQPYSSRGRMLGQKLVERRPADSKTAGMGKKCSRSVRSFQKPDSGKRVCIRILEVDSERARRRHAVRHDSLAARFIDRWKRTI